MHVFSYSTMINKSTLTFLKKLKKNNHRDWFHANRESYAVASADFRAFIALLLVEFTKMNPKLDGLQLKDLVFRINRDVRFSANKAPYKTNFGAYLAQGGKKAGRAGFYIQVEPGNSFIAGGCWMPPAPQLKSIRQEIDYNLDDFNSILGGKSFKKQFGELSDCRLKTNPKGYDKSNPAINHLRQTSFIVEQVLEDDDLLAPSLTKQCVSAYQAMLPFLEFLNRSDD